MAGERLHEFDLDLCEHVLAQVRPHLRQPPERPRRPLPALDYDGFHRLTLPEWLGRGVATLPDPLADHLWAKADYNATACPLNDAELPPAGGPPLREHAAPAVLPLNDAELLLLAGLFDDPPLRCEDECVWVPYPALYRQYVLCLPEIRSELSQATAEVWASESAAFTARLCQDELPLARGMDAVHEWLWAVRHLLAAMGENRLLPIPIGHLPTPTNPVPAAVVDEYMGFSRERFMDLVNELRRVIRAMPDGRTAKVETVIGEAQVRRTDAKKVLRWLEREGEYDGFARRTPARYSTEE